MKLEIRYRWRVPKKTRTGRDGWSTHAVPLTEAEAAAKLPGAVRIDGSREECKVLDQPCERDLHGHMAGAVGPCPAILLSPPLPGYGARQETMLRRKVCEHLIRQDGARWIVTLARAGTLMYDGPGPVEIVARVPFAPGPPQPRNPTLLRTRHRGERVLPLPPEHYEVQEHAGLATVYELATNEVIYQGPAPVEVVRSRAPF